MLEKQTPLFTLCWKQQSTHWLKSAHMRSVIGWGGCTCMGHAGRACQWEEVCVFYSAAAGWLHTGGTFCWLLQRLLSLWNVGVIPTAHCVLMWLCCTSVSVDLHLSPLFLCTLMITLLLLWGSKGQQHSVVAPLHDHLKNMNHPSQQMHGHKCSVGTASRFLGEATLRLVRQLRQILGNTISILKQLSCSDAETYSCIYQMAKTGLNKPTDTDFWFTTE